MPLGSMIRVYRPYLGEKILQRFGDAEIAAIH